MLTAKRLIGFFVFWALSVYLLVFIVTQQAKPNERAVILMGGGLIFSWIVIGGLLQRRYREPVRKWIQSIPWDWRIKYVLFATVMALIEEAITTTMTNCAPLFGVKVGEAYITASANYLDVVLGHSVVVFVPMFLAHALLLKRYAFTAEQMLLLYGFTGWLAELGTFGPQNIGLCGMWVCVYGLMVYLPAYSIPQERGARAPRWYHFPLTVFLPFLFVPLTAVWVWKFHPVHIHFPPIQ